MRERIKIKVRHDGQKLIIPMVQLTQKYTLQAKITKLKGNCFDIEFLQNVFSLEIKKGEQIPNVPSYLFRKDLDCRPKYGVSLEWGAAATYGSNGTMSYLEKFAPYIDPEKCAIARVGQGKLLAIKQEPTDDHAESSTAISSEYPQVQRPPHLDAEGKIIREKRSRWARIGESVQHMDV